MEMSNTPKNDIFIRDRNEIFVVKMERGKKDKAYSIQFKHNFQNATLFKMAEESDGTARLFDLLEILLSKSSKTYVIDELDRCLHPCLSYQFVKAFFEYSKNRNVQLIVTTHESRLMDFDLLRRDEIWFVDKDQSGASNIYSLEEYNERFDKSRKYDWLSKDRAVQDAYAADKYCTFHFTVSAMQDLVVLNKKSNDKEWFASYDKARPTLLVSGSEDPVGDYGKGVAKVYEGLKNAGCNIKMKLYENCRHEILNETCRDEVTKDIFDFIGE